MLCHHRNLRNQSFFTFSTGYTLKRLIQPQTQWCSKGEQGECHPPTFEG